MILVRGEFSPLLFLLDNYEWIDGLRVIVQASVMTRLFDPHHKSPYADVLNVRFWI